ncbi:MAG: hypothetical protein K2W97_07260 [Chthoniobacterales bacterium]|nr:hypothetical protein [Chthoniobacterales bacterium]
MKPIFILFLVCAFSSIDLFGFEYGGFSLDDTILQNEADRVIVETTFKKQVDVVNAVTLPADMLAILHAVRIRATRDETDHYAGLYIRGGYQSLFHFNGSEIFFNATFCLPNKLGSMGGTTLLHEFMHAIHDLYPPGNYNDLEVMGYFYEARHRDCYDFSDYGSSNPYMQYQEYIFTNHLEFFAETAVTYLYGTSDMQPFSREAIQQEQPQYYAFLQRFFNPADSRYNPSYNWWNQEQTTY